MATKKRTSKKAPVMQAPVIPEEEEMFTSAATFDFDASAAAPRMTRSRRASMSFEVSAPARKRMSLAPSMVKVKEEPKTSSRRQSMGPAVLAKKIPSTPKKTAKKSVAKTIVEEDSDEFIFDPTPSRGITPSKKKISGPPSKIKASGTPSIGGITPGSFYSSPKKSILKGTVANPLVASVSPQKSCVQSSPTKKFSKTTKNTLTDEDIEESLMVSKALAKGTKTPKIQKASLQVSPSKKVSTNANRTLTEKDIEASLMAEFDNKTPTGAKIPPKTFETTMPTDKKKPRRREVAIKSPVVQAFNAKAVGLSSRIPIKSPPTTPLKGLFVPQILPVGSPIISSILKEIRKVEIRLTPLRIKEDPNVIFSLLESEHMHKNRVQKVVDTLVAKYKEEKPKTRKSLDNVEQVEKPSTKNTKKTPQVVNKPSKSKTIETPVALKKIKLEVMSPEADVVEVHKPKGGRPPKMKSPGTLKIAEEKTPKSKIADKSKTKAVANIKTPKVKSVIAPKTEVVKTTKAKAAVERTDNTVVDTPKAKAGRPRKRNMESEAVVITSISIVAEKTPKAKVEKTPKAKVGMTPKATVEKTPKAKVGKTPMAKVGKTPKAKVGKTPKAKIEKTPKAKVEKSPKAKVENTPKIKVEKTPKAKVEKTPKTIVEKRNPSPTVVSRGIKRSLDTANAITPSNKRLKIEEPSPKLKSSKKKSSPKVTPLVAKPKYKLTASLALSALKKPLKRLTKAAVVTPAQVKPSDLLRRNMKRQVETAITAKVATRPDSSPYAMDVSENNSPVFRKVEQEEKTVKQHLTGTPARAKPTRTRKFGSVIQPSELLLENSTLPLSKRISVSSSTPLRSHPEPTPHPLEAVMATPIKSPSYEQEAVSPQPLLVTGGLAKMCSIM
jgi:hypothetical protein